MTTATDSGRSDATIIAVTARGEEADRVLALDEGAEITLRTVTMPIPSQPMPTSRSSPRRVGSSPAPRARDLTPCRTPRSPTCTR
ncbi:hypothetical protein ACWCXH_13430 [Kitasatospora sp. NPDC001660]